ncbi:unnamed protein product [Orchesella dallaii]|uniref:CXXC-type domain-containing protein n=1 Tax=Orchesella dallaii TaxID=48710 RepID=A0ABP1R3S7_9HEXA
MMSESQGPGGGALEPHGYNVGFGAPPSSTKGYVSNVLSEGSQSHLTLLKNASLPVSWLGEQHDVSRLSDFSEMRYLELNNWDLSSSYPSDNVTARLVDSRSMDSNDQPINYRPWEKPTNGSHPQSTTSGSTVSTGTLTNRKAEGRSPNGVSSTNEGEKSSPPTLTPLQNAFPNFPSETFSGNGNKLPSFQSQFNGFAEGQEQTAPILPSFHTLPANRPPYVPGHHHPGHPHVHAASPMGHREQQPFLDERHVQLFPGQVAIGGGQFPQLIATSGSNGHHNAYVNTSQHGSFVGGTHHHHHHQTLQLQELVPVPPMILHHPVAVTSNSTTHKLAQQITTDGSIPGLNLNIIENQSGCHFPQNIPKYVNEGPIEAHVIAVKLPPHAYEHNPPTMVVNNHHHQITKIEQPPHVNGNGMIPNVSNGSTPTKKQGKRKRSETNGEAHQVSSVSSTDSNDFKRPNGTSITNGKINGHSSDDQDKPVKKKRKRCGECTGCQRKDNCGECAPCRNDKSHQICKQRRCDKLTEKKVSNITFTLR